MSNRDPYSDSRFPLLLDRTGPAGRSEFSCWLAESACGFAMVTVYEALPLAVESLAVTENVNVPAVVGVP